MATATRERRVTASAISRREPDRRPGPSKERPLWQVLCLLYGGIVVLAAVVMALTFWLAQALA